jgi:hypothetical protein
MCDEVLPVTNSIAESCLVHFFHYFFLLLGCQSVFARILSLFFANSAFVVFFSPASFMDFFVVVNTDFFCDWKYEQNGLLFY